MPQLFYFLYFYSCNGSSVTSSSSSCGVYFLNILRKNSQEFKYAIAAKPHRIQTRSPYQKVYAFKNVRSTAATVMRSMASVRWKSAKDMIKALRTVVSILFSNLESSGNTYKRTIQYSMMVAKIRIRNIFVKELPVPFKISTSSTRTHPAAIIPSQIKVACLKFWRKDLQKVRST